MKAPTGFCELFPREMGGGRAAFSLLSPLPAGREGARPPWSGPLARRFLLSPSASLVLGSQSDRWVGLQAPRMVRIQKYLLAFNT